MINYLDHNNMTFDYIIVGSGPAGCVLAKELSKDRINSVLLLEAGENNDKDIQIRDSTTNLYMYKPQYFWQGETIPQINNNNATFDWTTGRLSGGGSSVNGEHYVRPSIDVLNEWEMIAGPMWGADEAIANFEMIEKNSGHGVLNTQHKPENVPAMTEKIVSAIEQATGYQTIQDYNNPNTPIGPFTRWHLTQKPDGDRESASTAFLSKTVIDGYGFGFFGRRLIILYNSTVLRIIFNTQNDAVAIEFLKEGNYIVASARKKIIVSAGINSSQLLMLSGIGPREYLNRLKIPVFFDNPYVGQNLVNHTFNTASFTINPSDIPGVLMDPTALYVGGAFLPSPDNSNGRRGVQLIGSYANGTLNILIILLSPKSRGNIIIQNNDPLKIVLADFNMLESNEDLELIKSIYKKYIRNIANELSAIDPNYQLVSPGFDIIDNDELLEQFMIDNIGITYHQQSSLRMAPYNEGGVVDNTGSVYGVNNLIVADCSIIPSTTDGDTQAPSYLIGYTIAKHILAEDKVHFTSDQYHNKYCPFYNGCSK